MRTFFQNSILVFFFFFILSFVVEAVTPIPTSFFSLPVPGVNCGDALSSSMEGRKCCKVAVNDTNAIINNIKAPSFAGVVVDSIKNYLNETDWESSFYQSSKSENNPCVISGHPSTPGDPNNDNCICVSEPVIQSLDVFKPICSTMSPFTNERDQCNVCVGNGGYWSSLGCFSGNVSEFITQKILRIGVGLAGGISLLCIMFAAFQMQTSSGNAEKIKKAQELLTNCITGLMVIIFSILILKIIGVDILKLPRFR